MTLQGPLGTSLESRNTTQESMVRRNGSVISAPRDMLFNLIGKPTPRFVALENIDVIVEPFSLGMHVNFFFFFQFTHPTSHYQSFFFFFTYSIYIYN